MWAKVEHGVVVTEVSIVVVVVVIGDLLSHLFFVRLYILYVIMFLYIFGERVK